jgi:hypothetical protein
MKIHWLLTNQNPGFLYQVKLKIKCIVGAQLSKVNLEVFRSKGFNFFLLCRGICENVFHFLPSRTANHQIHSEILYFGTLPGFKFD